MTRINFSILLIISQLSLVQKNWAEIDLQAPVPYVDFALGLSVHVLDESDQGAASQLLKTAVGIQWLPMISTQVGMWHWSGTEESNEESNEEEKEKASFEGISASWEVVLQAPLESKNDVFNYGPYYRLGRHCWSAVLTGLVQVWSKEGCSKIQTLGFVFPSVQYEDENAALYIEFTRSDFDDLSTSSMQLGAKLPF